MRVTARVAVFKLNIGLAVDLQELARLYRRRVVVNAVANGDCRCVRISAEVAYVT